MQLITCQRRGSASVLFVVFGFLFGFALSGAARAADLYVAPGGIDSGNCSTQAPACQTISYAIAQTNPSDRINIAAGTYDLGSNPALTIDKQGLQLVGEDSSNKPKIERTAGSANQPLLVVRGVKNVLVQDLEFDIDQSFVAEGVLAGGFVDGLQIVHNEFVVSKSASPLPTYNYRNAIAINYTQNSLVGTLSPLPNANGSTVTIDGNTIAGINTGDGAALRAGVQMDSGNGSIVNNTITAGVHDIAVRFSGAASGTSSGTTTLIDNNMLNGRGLELDVPNNSSGPITISNNHINATAGINDSISYPADFSLVRLMGKYQNVPVTLSDNVFAGYEGSYRGVLVENFPGTTFTNNTFTPALNAADFVSLVISNKALNNDSPPDAPKAISLTATGNTFNGSGTVAGRAVELLNDNDANGAAIFGSLLFGGAGTLANHFDGNLRWYFHLDDYSCSTNTNTVGSPPNQTLGGPGPLCGYLDYTDVNPPGGLPNTEARPFTGNVIAGDNTFAGVAPGDMTPMQMNALLAQTYDTRANALLGMVDYSLSGIDSVVYVDTGFSGSYGTALSFTSPAAACGNGNAQTVYFGVNAFATISDGASHVQSAGTMCIAADTFADNVIINKPVTIVGAGQGQTVIMPAAYNPDCVVGGGSASMCSGGTVPASVVMLVRASDVDISGLTVDGINPGLAGHTADIAARNGIMADISGGPFTNFKVHDTTVQNIYLRGIYSPDTGSTFEFRNNTVTNVKSDPSSIAIFNYGGSGIVDGNHVSGAYDAIAANHSLGTTFSNNVVTDSFSGIHTDNNNDGAGGTADVIANNMVDCNVEDAYGIFTFVPYKDVSIHDNQITRCVVGIGAFGGLFGSHPIATSTFTHNNVDGSGAVISSTPGDSTAGAYLSTTTFSYGDTDNVVALIGNTFTGFDQGIYAERTGGKSLITTAHFNRIVGNGEGLFDDGGAGASDFTNNWWGCNAGPNASGCDSASGGGNTNPWLVMKASATPSTINAGDPSQIDIDLTHNSNNTLVGTAFPDGTTIGLNASRGTLPASVDSASGQAQATLTGLTYGYSTVTTSLDNATVKLIVSVTPAAAHVTVNDDTTGTNPDADATCPTPDFNTITDAINTVAANTKILVCSGNYPESVIVNKSVMLKGPFDGTPGASRTGNGEAVINPSSPTVSNGAAVKILADKVTFSGFTISDVNNTAIASGANFGGASSNAQILDNRVLNVVSGSGLYTNGPNPAATNWNVSDNLFQDIHSTTGSGINLWKASGGTIHGNVVMNTGFAGIQVVVGSGVQITGNRVTNTAHNGIQVTQGQNVQVSGNSVTDANTSGASADGGVTLGLDSSNVAVYCNSVSGSGTNGFSTTPSTLDGSGLNDSGISVYHNAITVGSDISHNLTQSIVIGSNWYGGGAPTINGSNAAGAQVASALPATPINDPNCGDNTPTQIVVVSGSNQHALITSAFGNPLIVRVEDALGGAVAGEPVKFTAPGSGASASLASPSGSSDYNGVFSTTAIANAMAGSYPVTLADTNFTGIASASFTLYNERAAATITLNAADLNVTYDGNPHAVGATTNPTGLSYSVTYNGSLTQPSAVGSYYVVATITDASYTGTTNGTLNIVAAPVPDLGVTLDDGRQYVQYGKTLTYRIAISNVGNTAISGASITDTLPPELDIGSASWMCVPLGSATCTANGVGNLSDTFNVPTGGGLVYYLTASVRSDAAVPTEQVVNMVSVSASGDTNATNDTATSTTTIVIFRDGFEQGGDGAQATGAALANPVGSLDDVATLMLDPVSAPQALNTPSTWLRATDAAGREVFRIDSLRTANDVLVRVISSDANGQESHSQWIALGTQKAGLALASTSASTHALIVLGGKNASLQVAIPSWATLPLAVFSTQ